MKIFYNNLLKLFIDIDTKQETEDQHLFERFFLILPAQKIDDIADCLSSKILYSHQIDIFDNYQIFIKNPNNKFFRTSRQKAYEGLNKKFFALTEFTSNEFCTNTRNENIFHLLPDTADYNEKRSKLQQLTNEFCCAYLLFVKTARKYRIGIIIWILIVFLVIFSIFSLYLLYSKANRSLSVSTMHLETSIEKSKIEEMQNSANIINSLYFYSYSYEEENGLYSINCPQTKEINWQLAIHTLSAYMQFEAIEEDYGSAEIQRNFDENCERNMRIYEEYNSRIITR